MPSTSDSAPGDQPLDSDLVAVPTREPSQRVHLGPQYVVLAVVGGTIGTGLRYAAETFVSSPGRPPWPLGTLTVNLTGAWMLGLLLEILIRSGPDRGRRRAARIAVGTGLIGGFTTYSSFAVETSVLLTGGHPLQAMSYALGTVVLGLGGAVLGVAVARRVLPDAGSS